MDFKLIRENSLKRAAKLGFPTNQSLPLLDGPVAEKSDDEIFKRLMCLHVAAACAYGFDRRKAWEWIAQEALLNDLAQSESYFISDGARGSERFKVQIEGMWALSWALGLVGTLDFSKGCDSQFAALLPNLKNKKEE